MNKIIQIVRKDLEKADQQELDDLLASRAIDSEKYQAAFQFLSFRKEPGFRENVVRFATLNAVNRKFDSRPSAADLAEIEADVDIWRIPEGAAALGRIWAGLPTNKRGPLLTTNFDPLIEVGIRRAGGSATTHVHSDDSSFLTNLRVQIGSTVIHLHGFWRESSTLHTPEQLALDRPALAAALRVILQQHTLVVIGYGGWSDVISRQINTILREQNAMDLDVLWCMYESGEEFESAFSKSETLRELRSAPGNIVFYGGIDANIVLPALETQVSDSLTYTDSPRSELRTASLVGWTSISSDFLDRHHAQDSIRSAVTFFDGRLPTWRDAASDFIPMRDVAREAVNVVRAATDSGSSSFTGLIGPSGEGKSTALMQAAAALRRSESDLTVLFLDGDHFGSESDVLSLPHTGQYLLVIDDAHRFLDRLRTVVSRLNEEGRPGIHFLVASRDSDWRNRGGSAFAWNRHVETRFLQVEGINRPDAVALVTAWEAIGEAALGELQHLASREDRIQSLMRAASDQRLKSESSLLGALLVTRYGAGLREHIRELMNRASDWSFVRAENGQDVSLLDALVMIALPHANGVYQLNFDVLARALNVSQPELLANVLAPLGQEAAISYSSNHVLIRHRYIADVVCELATELGVNVQAICRDLVQASARAMDEAGFDRDLVELASFSTRLPAGSTLSIVAAQAAVDAVPMRLSYRTSLSAALRRARRPGEAARSNEDAVSILRIAADTGGTREFLNEWGVVEGNLNQWSRNVVLVGLALQDSAWVGPLSAESAGPGIACLVLALKKLCEHAPNIILLEALAAAVAVAESVGTGHNLEMWLREAEILTERYGLKIPRLVDSKSVSTALHSGCMFARQQLESTLPDKLPPQNFNFGELILLATNAFARNPRSN